MRARDMIRHTTSSKLAATSPTMNNMILEIGCMIIIFGAGRPISPKVLDFVSLHIAATVGVAGGSVTHSPKRYISTRENEICVRCTREARSNTNSQCLRGAIESDTAVVPGEHTHVYSKLN